MNNAYESAVEQIEGAVNYVELAALEQLSLEKHRAELNRMKKNLRTSENLIPVRILSYSVGALLFRLLHMQGSAQVTAFMKILVTTAMLDGAPNLPVSMPKESLVIRRLIDEYAQETERVIRLALDKGIIVLNGVCELLNVAIYDASALSDLHIVCHAG